MSTEIPLNRTHQVRDACLCLHVRRAARVLGRRFDEAFRPLGITNGQFSLLTAINRPQPPSMGAVARVLAMDRTNLTAALKPLQREGLLAVEMDPDDRRGRRLRLTRKGHRLLARALPVWEEAQAEMEALLGTGSAERLRKGLRRLEQGAVPDQP